MHALVRSDEGNFMAVAAETSPTPYIFVDSFPDIAQERQAVRSQAEATLEDRRLGGALAGDQQTELLPIDALSGAQRVKHAAHRYGEGSAEHAEAWDAHVLDCRRLMAEWYRKLRPEHFAPIRHTFNSDSQDYFLYGTSTGQVTQNALVPMPDKPEEEARRVAERLEEATPAIVRRRLGAAALRGTVIRTMSECPDWAVADYQEDMKAGNAHAGYGGYVPEIDKLKIRDIVLDEQTGDRWVEEISLPGTYIAPIIRIALGKCGLDADHLDKTGLLGSQILAKDSLMQFVQLLDSVASEQWATTIYLGEEVAPDFVRDYSAFPTEAFERQKKQLDMALTLANFVYDLVEDDVDRRRAPAMVEQFVKIMLLNHAKQNLGAAEEMFNQETAIGLQQVIELEARGQFAEAERVMQEVEKNAPGGGYCGASCDIKRFNENGEKAKRIKEKLKAEAGDTLVEDKGRRCRNCSQKGQKGKLYYAYSPTKVNKYCDACGATDYKTTPFRAKS